MNPFPPSSHIYAYLRDSGHDDQELSVPQQERQVRQWANENGLILEHVYADVARKGSSVVKRDELQAMMHAFRRGAPVAGVAIWKWNRFARNVDNAQFFRAEIRTRGYIFHSLNDDIPDGPIGRVFEAILDYKDEQYVLDLAVDVKRGVNDLVRIYGCVPGTPPIGFKRQPVTISYHRDGSPHTAARWVPDPEIVPRLVRAFDLFAAGSSLGAIHKDTQLCNAINSYTSLFANKLYIGILEYGDQVIEDYCEPVIARSVWDLAQARRQKYAMHRHTSSDSFDHPRRANSRYLLSGLAHCALCGSPMYGHTSHDKGRNGAVHTYESYYCSQAPRRRNCTRRRIPRLPFEAVVIHELRHDILQPDFFTAAYTKLAAEQSSHLAEIDLRLAELSGQLTTVRKQLTHISKAIKAAGHSKTLLNDLKQLEADETELISRQIALQEQRQPVPEISPERLAELLPAAADLLAEGSTEEQKRLALRALVHHVDVERDGNTLRGIIYYYYPPSDLTHLPEPAASSGENPSDLPDSPSCAYNTASAGGTDRRPAKRSPGFV